MLILLRFFCVLLCLSLVRTWEATKVLFPPVIDAPEGEGRLVGHLKPFGHQRSPEKPVTEYETVLKPPEFWEKHVKDKIPAVFRGGVAESPAQRLWTDEYLSEKYGDDYNVLYERRDEDRKVSARKMSLRKFLAEYQKQEKNIYAVTLMPEDMRREVRAIDCLLCGTFSRNIQESNFWLGYGGTRSVIHFDADHNIHCLLAGHKDFMMIHPRFADKLDMAPRWKYQGSGHSYIDPDAVDLDKTPFVRDVEWEWTTLLPGDCIFIPGGHLHQVRSYGRSISATVLFTPLDTFDDEGCENTTFEYTDLSQVKLIWTYKRGEKDIHLGFMNPELMRRNLFNCLKDGIVTREAFFDMLLIAAGEEETSTSPAVLFDLLDVHSRGYLTEEDVETMSLDLLKELALTVDSKSYEEDDDEDTVEQKDEL